MKLLSITHCLTDGKTIITVEEPFFIFWRKKRSFKAVRHITGTYWEWLELPDYMIVCDYLSFQLDAWKGSLQ
jgi:hypothetical protein